MLWSACRRSIITQAHLSSRFRLLYSAVAVEISVLEGQSLHFGRPQSAGEVNAQQEIPRLSIVLFVRRARDGSRIIDGPGFPVAIVLVVIENVVEVVVEQRSKQGEGTLLRIQKGWRHAHGTKPCAR